METYERILTLLENLINSAQPVFGNNIEWPAMNDELYCKVDHQVGQAVLLISSKNRTKICEELSELRNASMEWFQKARRDRLVPALVFSICENIEHLGHTRWYGTATFPLTIQQTVRETLAMIAAAHAQLLTLAANDLYYAIDEKIKREWSDLSIVNPDISRAEQLTAHYKEARLMDLQELLALAQSWVNIARRNCAHVGTLANAEAALASLSAYVTFAEREVAKTA